MEGQQSFLKKVTSWGPFGFIASSILYKLLAVILLMSMLPLSIMGYVAINQSSQALYDQASNAMDAMKHTHQRKLTEWFNNHRLTVSAFASNPLVATAAEEMLYGIEEMGAGVHARGIQQARELYIGQPDLNDAEDGSGYSMAHLKYNEYFKHVAESGDYINMYILDEEGLILYNANKDETFAANLNEEQFRDTKLFEMYHDLLQDKREEYVLFEDFTKSPFADRYTAFLAAPISIKTSFFFLSGEKVQNQLWAIFEIDIEEINKLLDVDMGETGEIYAVGPDGLWRCDSRFLGQGVLKDVQTTIMNPDTKVETAAFQRAMSGEEGSDIMDDYRGVKVMSSWGRIQVQEPTAANPNGIHWVLLSEMDDEEIGRAPDRLMLIFLGFVVGAFLLVCLVGYIIARNLVQQVEAIQQMFGEIGMGDFDARAEVISQDELGTMASSLNSMLDNTTALIQSREERDQIQSSIMNLLEEVSGLADGDLSIEAVVTADVTGALADSYNFMIEQLRDIISNVQDATLQVSSSANEIQTTAEHLAQGSESQALQITDTSAAIDEMAVSIQQVSENAALSATVGEQAKANAQQGTKAVHDTIDGMHRIREQVQETAKRIKRLGESSQEIGEIIQLIGDIADRTSILALNASIQAAMAGEAGRGFAVVAEEVERLAERSTNATKQIDTLVKTIQTETNEAMAAMESTTHEVVEGTSLSDQAGRALGEIEAVSNRLAELIQSISLASKQQARGSEALSGSMVEIAEVTQQTAAGTKQAAVSINNLAVLADNLRESVARFRLPDDYQRDA